MIGNFFFGGILLSLEIFQWRKLPIGSSEKWKTLLMVSHFWNKLHVVIIPMAVNYVMRKLGRSSQLSYKLNRTWRLNQGLQWRCLGLFWLPYE